MIVALSILFATAALACECKPVADPSFIISAQEVPLVIQAKVERHSEKKGSKYLAMDLKVIRVFQGALVGRELRVWGDNGILCRPYVTQFPENSEWIFALNRGGDTWYISICRENWLRVENGRTKGNIEGRGASEMELEDLAAKLKRPLTIGSAGTAEAARRTPTLDD